MPGLVYFVLTFLRRLACLLPRRVAFGLGACLGQIWYVLDAHERRVAKSNLVNAFPEWSHRRVCGTARAVFRHLAQMALEFLRAPLYRDPAYRRRWISVVGEEHLRATLALGRGIICLTAHLGNWELAGLVGAEAGYPSLAIADRIGSKGLTRFLNETRAMAGMRVVDRRHAVRPVLAELHAGGCISTLMDLNAGRTGLDATFFGRVCPTARGPAAFALKTGAPIVPVMCTRRPGDRYEIRAYEPVVAPHTGDDERDVAELTQRLTSFVEACVRESPEQWQWQYRRWKPARRGLFRKGFRYVETILVWVPESVEGMAASRAACAYLKQAYPHSRLAVVVKAPLGEVLRDWGEVDEVIERSPRRGLRGLADYAGMIRRVRQRYFHVALVLADSLGAALAATLAGIPLRVGAPGRGRRWFLTHVVRPRGGTADAHDHYVRIAARLARAPAAATGAKPSAP